MKTGEIRRLVIPAEQGYGERAVGPIPANSTLVFEVELVSFEKGIEPDEFPKNLNSFAWKTQASGVEIFDEKIGEGVPARPGMTIKAQYTGWLPGGTMVASSKSKGKPADLLLGASKLIKGWESGLAGVQPGAVRWLRLQPAMAYGSNALPRIPPNSVLIYRIEVNTIETEEGTEGMDFFPNLDSIDLQNGREGLQYAVITPPTDSTAAPAQAGKKVKVQYTGWLTDGSTFDSSRNRNVPFEFPLGAGKVIRGWDIGVEGMRPGEKRILVVPPGIGYGSRGAGPIPPDATLIFQVEYLGTSVP
jgi:peptidylprolyl isomerase